MFGLRKSIKKFLVATVLSLFLFLSTASGFLLFAEQTNAQTDDALIGVEQGIRGVVSPLSDPAQNLADIVKTVRKEIIKTKLTIALKTVLVNLFSFVLNRLAYDAATYLAAGATGQEPGFEYKNAGEYFADLGLDVATSAFDSLGEVLDEAFEIEFDICDPGNPMVKLGLQFGIASAYQRPEPRCDWSEFTSNWEASLASFQDYALLGENPSEYFIKEFKKAYSPGQSQLDASIKTNVRVHEKVWQAKTRDFSKSLSQGGFKDVTDYISGNIKTPGVLLQEQVEEELVRQKNEPDKEAWKAIINDKEWLANSGLSMGSVFLNTFLSKLMSGIYSGLVEPDPTDFDYFDMDDVTVGTGGREAAEEAYSDLLTAEFLPLDDFNALNELVACPGSDSRNLFNCAADTSLTTALSRAESGAPMTVQEALEEGLLHGEWPLYPSDDFGSNQDPYCYTYGYCYGNLVKMRKFRIIPVGWEIAANSPYNTSTNPITLQEVVDGFNDCGPDGAIGPNYPWCHLIDPNWVLKAPQSSCPFAAPGELLASSMTGIRLPSCADMTTCIAEDQEGNCVGGEAYCTREKNTWRFRGDECPEEYASCLSFTNANTNELGDWLLNTVDFDSCTADNAGCRWYRTNKYLDDESYEWLPAETEYITFDEDIDTEAYLDRRYLNNDALECSEDNAGCTQLIEKGDDVVLNVVANPSFEDDENDDGLPDAWNNLTEDTYQEDESGSVYGLDYITSTDNLIYITQENIVLSASRFYTFSFYANETDASIPNDTVVWISLDDKDDPTNIVSLEGTAILGDCELDPNDFSNVALGIEDIGDDPERFECTFTTPAFDTFATIWIYTAEGEHAFDAFQLEEGSVLHDYQAGYGDATLAYEYLLMPPAYLGCTGAETDPEECANYAQMCTSQEVGCELYTPADGDPSVPAIVSELDECPSECVGYDTYKQEATLYDDEDFPLYFIPDTANSCTESDVGCDEFTNLDSIDLGGEGLEYYTYLRACTSADDTTEEATFFSWEGSAQTGYQLVSWDLLESDLGSATKTFAESGVEEVNVGAAPCINPVLSDETTLVCDDVNYQDEDGNNGWTAISLNSDCDEHDDIFDNPDCREFYDSDGNIHYREFSLTATITDQCHPYRKSESAEEDCDGSGGYWTAGGECRYLGYIDESTTCTESANGCRSYTGGAGRNATTIFSDDVEDDSLEEWFGTADAVISNESVAAGGHSIHVTSGTLDLLYLIEDDATDCEEGEVCDLEDPAGTGANCEIIGSEDLDDCGSLVGALVQGKTYILSFWAKGTEGIGARFIADGGNGDFETFEDELVDLSTGWQLYELGPLDTTDFEDFDDTALLRIRGTGEYYIDNIYLKEVEDSITLIKDSWVTPSTCDETPEGVEAEQFYLGCEEYSDGAGDDFYLYRFSNICSESAVGCESFFTTQNSESTFAQAYNVTCSTVGGGIVSTPTACEMSGQTVCTIGVSQSSCQFDWDGALPNPLPIDGHISLGPEAVVVPNDIDVFLINDSSATCSSTYMGCTEFGQPTFNQDKSEVTEFESIYLYDLPDEYETTLCNHEALFCEAWETTADGNFYFKDPIDQTCEWKDSATINNQTYYGWFRAGTNDPCYYTDENDKVGSAYLIAGEEFGVWRNGDDDFAGWAAECGSQHDRCTEFLDPVDTSEGDFPQGVPYYYVNNDELSEESLATSQQCSGEVSQNFGCILFDNTTDSELRYNASASYVSSVRADLLFGDAQYSPQTPITCDTDYGGQIDTPDLGTVDLCWSQCRYPDYTGIMNRFNRDDVFNSNYTFTTSCVVDLDCPPTQDPWGNEVSGECVLLDGEPTPAADMPTDKLVNDTNTILKVYRDRECAEWLACSSYSYNWDEKSGSWKKVCADLRSCNDYNGYGDSATCTNFPVLDPDPLTMADYAARDTTWFGHDYSGFTIPDSIPVDFLDQVNLTPSGQCHNGINFTTRTGHDGEPWPRSCAADDDCSTGTCEANSESDYRLAYVAGSCDEDNGELCTLGICSDTGEACAEDSECNNNDCVVGYCKRTWIGSSCLENSDCVGQGYGHLTSCDNGVCVNDPDDEQTGTCTVDANCQGELDRDGDGINDIFAECALYEESHVGACSNSQCIIDQYGDAFSINNSEEVECRGYPEADAPFPHDLVTEWKGFVRNPDPVVSYDTLQSLLESNNHDQSNIADAVPYDLTYSYSNVNICGPNDEDCLCSYNKASFGNGIYTRYFEAGRTLSEVQDDAGDGLGFQGICMGGTQEGKKCSDDSGCGGDFATCQIITNYDTHMGWEGYCLERDSSINRWGNQDGPGVCLTWLPVDQLVGSTDLYGKYTEAGFPLENEYYCVETGYYRDFYTAGISMDEDGIPQTSVNTQIACASTQYGEYRRDDDWWDLDPQDRVPDNALNGCWQYVYCPEGYKGIVAFPVDQDDGYQDGYNTRCMDDDDGGTNDFYGDDAGNGWHDCPYICIPNDSYTPAGESCEQEWNTSFNRDFDASGTVEEDEEESYFGTPVKWAVKLGDDDGVLNTFNWHRCVRRGVPVARDVTDYEMDWHTAFWVGDPTDPGVQVGGKYVAGQTEEECYDAASLHELDCELLSEAVYPDDWPTPGMGLDFSCFYSEDELVCDDNREGLAFGRLAATNHVGFWGLDYTNINVNAGDDTGAFYEYLGCFAMAQVATDDMSSNNKAYTQRLLYDGDDSYATQEPGDGVYNNLYITKDDGNPSYSPAGALPFEDYFEPKSTHQAGTLYIFDKDMFYNDPDLVDDEDVDSGPIPVLACDDGTEALGAIGLHTVYDEGTDCDGDDIGFYPTNYQWSFIDNDNLLTSLGLSYEVLRGTDEAQIEDRAQGAYANTFDDIGQAENMQSSYELLGQFFNKVFEIFLWEWKVENDNFQDIAPQAGQGAYFSLDDCVADDNCELYFPGRQQAFDGEFDDGTPFDFAGVEDLMFGKSYAYDQDPVLENPQDYETEPTAPTTVSLGQCWGSYCREDEEDEITLNDQDHGNYTIGGGAAHVTMEFFIKADPNQFPIRNIIVDWGDESTLVGSQEPDNFYKAYRGLQSGEQENSICSAEGAWGETSESCISGYVTYVHDYVCPQWWLDDEARDECEYHDAPDGKEIVLNAPCKDASGSYCVYQPRVHIRDNWGYCSGYCEGGDDLGGDLCYDGLNAGAGYNECDLDCPSGNCPKALFYGDDADYDNPWVYYDGQVMVSPN